MIEINEIFKSIGDNSIFKSIFSSALLMAIIISVVIILLIILMLDVSGSTGKFILVGIISTAIIGSGMAVHNSINRYISEKETTEVAQLQDLSEIINPSIINKMPTAIGAKEVDNLSSTESPSSPDVKNEDWDFMIEESKGENNLKLGAISTFS
jgi:hypothetical protein